MIRTKITIGGTEYGDYRNLRLDRNIGDFVASANYTVVYDSPYGRHKNDFTVGQEIKIFADKDAAPTTNIFTGIVEKISFEGEGTKLDRDWET